MRLSIVIPCLNEAAEIGATLRSVEPARERGAEIIVVDGGSSDDTVEFARAGADVLIVAPRGRARQMNGGAARARGDILLFLHADSRPPPDVDTLVLQCLAARDRCWGRFDVRISGRHSMLPAIAWFMNTRSRWTGIATGDQAIFVRRDVFERLGGYPDMPLMEDIALTSALRRIARPVCLPAHVITSGRRWEKHGVFRTILKMWRLRLEYWSGTSASALAKRYAPHRDG